MVAMRLEVHCEVSIRREWTTLFLRRKRWSEVPLPDRWLTRQMALAAQSTGETVTPKLRVSDHGEGVRAYYTPVRFTDTLPLQRSNWP